MNPKQRPHLQSTPAPLFAPGKLTPSRQGSIRGESASRVEIHEKSQLSDSSLDWSRVYRIRERVTRELSDNPSIAEASSADQLQFSRTIIPSQVAAFSDEAVRRGRVDDKIALEQRDLYGTAVEAAIFGYGRWTPLFEDPDVENIELRGFENTFMVYGDRIEEAPRVADSNQELVDQLHYLATYMASTPKTFSVSTPAITLNLGDRFRLHAMGFDIVDRPSIVIRQHKHVKVTLADLVDLDMMPAHVADFLAACMVAGKSIIVSGPQGAGKTTFLRALAAALPPMRSIGVIESDPELFLHKLPGRHRIINLLAREGSPEALGANGRPAGEIGIDRLLRESKRQYFDMVSVGEILGNEAAMLFEAMQSGTGSFSTIHSQHASATIERIVTAAAQGGILTTEDAYRQVGTLLDLVVHIRTIDTRHLPGGKLTRFVSEILEIQGFQEDAGKLSSRPATNPVYNAKDPIAPLTISPEMAEDLRNIGWRG